MLRENHRPERIIVAESSTLQILSLSLSPALETVSAREGELPENLTLGRDGLVPKAAGMFL